MSPNAPLPESDLETLSALFDGELQGDAARFAIKRLSHDARWGEAIGGWQLAGDVLRGQRPLAAPGDFAARVTAAVAAQPMPVASPGMASAAAASGIVAAVEVPTVASTVMRRRWMGGAALAASVAMVAMFIARPFSQDASAPTPATELAAAPTSIPAQRPAQPAPVVAASSLTVAAPDAGVAPIVAASALAVADLQRRTTGKRNSGQTQRAALRTRSRQPAPAVVTTGAAVLASSETLRGPTVNPFHPRAGALPVEAMSRPWPRAVLPAASGAFTASYVGAAVSPSFYPFEPSQPTASGGTVAPLETDAQQP